MFYLSVSHFVEIFQEHTKHKPERIPGVAPSVFRGYPERSKERGFLFKSINQCFFGYILVRLIRSLDLLKTLTIIKVWNAKKNQ